MFFLSRLLATEVLIFDWIAGSSQLITLEDKEGVRTKAKFRRKLTPGALLTILLTYHALSNRSLILDPYGEIPFTTVGDSVFPSQSWLLKP